VRGDEKDGLPGRLALGSFRWWELRRQVDSFNHRLEASMARIARILALVPALAASAAQAQSQAGSVWNLDYAKVADGPPPQPNHIALVAGMATRPDLRLENGVIEFDLAPPSERFAGVAFRMQNGANYEIVYFRPADDGTRWAAMQYQPVFDGETTWQLYHGAGYEGPVLASLGGKDLHVRILLSGSRADILLGDDTVPALRIPRLLPAVGEGDVGFWVAPGIHATPKPTVLHNLRVDRSAALNLAPAPVPASDPTQLNEWMLSARMPNDSIFPPVTLPDFVLQRTGKWISATAEPGGLINLNRYLGNAAGAQKTNVFGGAGWGIAYARIRIMSDRQQTRRLSFSYSDGIGVYVDSRRVFVGRNDSDSRYAGYLGIVGAEADGIDLRLKRGATDVVLAVTDKAFGWGFRAKLDSLTGIRVETPAGSSR
jgi:hypothetical protein